MTYIEIPNWSEYQHYKNRNPPWIKMHTRLLRNPKYLELTLSQRGLLHGLWLLYAKNDGIVRENLKWLSEELSQRVTSSSLKALNEAGFIRLSASKRASKVLAPEYRENLNPGQGGAVASYAEGASQPTPTPTAEEAWAERDYGLEELSPTLYATLEGLRRNDDELGGDTHQSDNPVSW